MKVTAHDITRALIDLSKTLPDGEQLLREVRDELSRHVRQDEQMVKVTIVTPNGDSGGLKAAVLKILKQKYGHPPEIEEKADPSIIGGVIVTFNDEQIDLSVRGALRQAAETFVSTGTAPVQS